MTDCNQVKELLALWAGDDLSREDDALVERHLRTCDTCRAEAQVWREDLIAMRQRLAADGGPELPDENLDAAATPAMRTMRPRPRPRLLRRIIGVAGPVAAVLALVLWWRFPGSQANRSSNDGVAWSDLQDAFAGCLEPPVPLEQWQAGDGAGVVAILSRKSGGKGYVVTDCLEADDLSQLRSFPWAAQRIKRWQAQTAGPLLVSVCGVEAGGRAERRRLQRAVLARWGDGG